ncbi:MAG: hypothetical protein LBE56_00830 [Tannerella sp.]|jgi:hypothetical protein|nr:hypothetical protein [Tannerella sp.]
MKGDRLFILIITVFLVLVFVYQYFAPKEFVWSPTFYQRDKQPFGSYVFDDVMSSSTVDYKVDSKTFYQLYQEYGGTEKLEDLEEEEEETDYEDYYMDEEDVGAEEYTDEPAIYEDYDGAEEYPLLPPRAFLITEQYINLTQADVKAMLFLLRQGHKIMLCLHSIPGVLADSIGISYRYEWYADVKNIARYAREGNSRDSLFVGTDSLHPDRIYRIYPHFHPVVLEEDASDGIFSFEDDTLKKRETPLFSSSEVLVRDVSGDTLAMRFAIGNGELFLVTTPLMFTNYGVLDGDNASYAFRLLSYMKGLPVTRLESYGRFAIQDSGSPLRYFLRQPPLQWAVYMAVIVILLSMFFGMKRRQWVIPVLRPPANETLRFTQLIGNLYYQRKDYKDMLQKKYLYFSTEVKQLTGLDMMSDEPDEELCRRLSDKMGREFAAVRPVFIQFKNLLTPGTQVDERDMMEMIDVMNGWKNNLKM